MARGRAPTPRRAGCQCGRRRQALSSRCGNSETGLQPGTCGPRAPLEVGRGGGPPARVVARRQGRGGGQGFGPLRSARPEWPHRLPPAAASPAPGSAGSPMSSAEAPKVSLDRSRAPADAPAAMVAQAASRSAARRAATPTSTTWCLTREPAIQPPARARVPRPRERARGASMKLGACCGQDTHMPTCMDTVLKHCDDNVPFDIHLASWRGRARGGLPRCARLRAGWRQTCCNKGGVSNPSIHSSKASERSAGTLGNLARGAETPALSHRCPAPALVPPAGSPRHPLGGGAAHSPPERSISARSRRHVRRPRARDVRATT